MKILHLLKHDLADERNEWAANYRRIRKENPAKARFLYRRLKKAMDLTERSLNSQILDDRT